MFVGEGWTSLDALEKLVTMAVRKTYSVDDAEWLIGELVAVFRAARGMRSEPQPCGCWRGRSGERRRK